MIREANCPPPSGPQMFVHRLKAHESLNCVILGTKIVGYWTHWDGKATLPCNGADDDCSPCKRHLPKRWKGYLHVYDTQRKRQVFLEITPVAAECIKRDIPSEQPMRGIRLNITRAAGDKARLSISVWPADTSGDPQLWPAEKHPLETLLKLWGVEQAL